MLLPVVGKHPDPGNANQDRLRGFWTAVNLSLLVSYTIKFNSEKYWMDKRMCTLVQGQGLYIICFATIWWLHKNDAIIEGLELTFGGRNDLKSLGDLLS